MKPATSALLLAVILTAIGMWSCAVDAPWTGVLWCAAGLGCARESGRHAAARSMHEWEDEA